MLLAQKSYVEGALALVLYCARLVDDSRPPRPTERAQAEQLLGLLIPIVKSWPSQWCLAANDLAIQVLGGAGYTRDFDVEQHYRDNRLNPIHEGTHGIQAMDLLGRKVLGDGGAALRLLLGADARHGRAGGGHGCRGRRVRRRPVRGRRRPGRARPLALGGAGRPGGDPRRRDGLPGGRRPRRRGVAVAGAVVRGARAGTARSTRASARRRATSSPASCPRWARCSSSCGPPTASP